jgi:hypothetical protein
MLRFLLAEYEHISGQYNLLDTILWMSGMFRETQAW